MRPHLSPLSIKCTHSLPRVFHSEDHVHHITCVAGPKMLMVVSDSVKIIVLWHFRLPKSMGIIDVMENDSVTIPSGAAKCG